MNGRIARLTAATSADTPKRRKVSRTPANTVARLHSSHGDSASVSLLDLSTHGCCVRGAAEWIRIGCFVSIALGEEPALQAIVRWVRDEAAGLEFLRPVPPERSEWFDLLEARFGF